MKNWKKAAALLLIAVLALCGCADKHDGDEEEAAWSMLIDSTEGSGTEVTAQKAEEGDGGIGYVTIGEDEYLFCEIDGEEGGELSMNVYPYDPENVPENPADLTAGEPLLSEVLAVGSGGMFYLDPGEYCLEILVNSKTFTGTASFYGLGADEELPGIPNPWDTAPDSAAVEAALGFGLEAPDALGALHPANYFSYDEDLQLAELRYSETIDGSEWLKGSIRKAPADKIDPEESLSGVWEEYDEVKDVDGVTLSISGGLVKVAEWEADGFRYSIYVQDGLSEEDALAAVKGVK